MMLLFMRAGEAGEPLAGKPGMTMCAALHQSGIVESGQFGIMCLSGGPEPFGPPMKLRIE